ncbi:hypothetical protein D3C80_1722580 [compost metagenome]
MASPPSLATLTSSAPAPGGNDLVVGVTPFLVVTYQTLQVLCRHYAMMFRPIRDLPEYGFVNLPGPRYFGQQSLAVSSMMISIG